MTTPKIENLRRLSNLTHSDRLKIVKTWRNIRIIDGDKEVACIDITCGFAVPDGVEEVLIAYIHEVLQTAPQLLKIAEAAQSIFDHAYCYIDEVIGAPTEQFNELEDALKDIGYRFKPYR